MNDINEIYNSLLESKELFTMFPNAKGDWGKDEKEFTRLYNIDLEILNDNEIDEPEEYYED